MPPVPGGSSGGGLGEGVLAAIASAVFAIIVLAGLLTAFIVVRRRQRRREAAAAVIAKFTQCGPDTTASLMASGRMPFFDPQTAVRFGSNLPFRGRQSIHHCGHKGAANPYVPLANGLAAFNAWTRCMVDGTLMQFHCMLCRY